MTPEAFRKNLQRARAKFIELLVQELRETIHPTSNEDIEAEIFDLGLGHLYRRYTTLADDETLALPGAQILDNASERAFARRSFCNFESNCER